MTTAFCDSSAIVKLVLPEAESVALVNTLGTYSRRNACKISLVEIPRAVRRFHPDLESRAHRILKKFEMIGFRDGLLNRAGILNPGELRSLDAIQLAAALSVAEVKVDFIAYDQRLLDAARKAGLRTLSPS